MTISLDVSNKLPDGLLEVYGRIQRIALTLDMPLLIVGATARDIILVHGYNAAIERGTRDVDFGLEVSSWEHYQKMREALIKSGFTAHPKKKHQLNTTDNDGLPWEIDLIPFGGVSDAKGQITWPPEHAFQMSVLGFDEVYKHAWDLLLCKDPALSVKVASPAGILLLKLIAWTERGREYQGKDAIDIYYVIKHYCKIPDVFEALYEREYMEFQDYDDMKASAMMLADEVAAMAHGDTLNYIRQTLLNNERVLERLKTDITKFTRTDFDEAETLVNIIKERLNKA